MPFGDEIIGSGVLGGGSPADSGASLAYSADHKNALKLLYPLKDVAGDFEIDVTVSGARLDAVQTEIAALIAEMHPDTCYTTITLWEARYGIIPPTGAALAARRLAAAQKRMMKGRLDVYYFIELAAAAGFTIDIEELPPNHPDYGADPDTIHIWRVYVPIGEKEMIYFTAGDSAAGDLLTDWSEEEVLEGILNKLKPAHTRIYFIYE